LRPDKLRFFVREKYRNRLIFSISQITDCMEIRLFDHRQDHACLIIGWLQMNTRPNAQHAWCPMDRLQLENRSHLPIFFRNRAFFGQFQIATVRLQRPLDVAHPRIPFWLICVITRFSRRIIHHEGRTCQDGCPWLQIYRPSSQSLLFRHLFPFLPVVIPVGR
jgi:hypothetical protein